MRGRGRSLCATAARDGRVGLTLVEIMVVIGIIGLFALVAVPTIADLADVNQRAAAKTLAQTYTWMEDEAALRNVSFRVVYYLDRRTWKVEVGDANTLVFSTPEDREAFDREIAQEMKRFSERQVEEGEASEVQEKAGRFEGLDDPVLTTEQELPGGSRFLYVYTPQYGEAGARPSEDPPEDPEDEVVAYSYVFADGSAEHTVIRIVDEDDDEDGYTVVVEPMGRIYLEPDDVDPTQTMSWLPEEGPTIE